MTHYTPADRNEIKRIPHVAKYRRSLAQLYRSARRENPAFGRMVYRRMSAALGDAKTNIGRAIFSSDDGVGWPDA